MPSLDERREVAENLRTMTMRGCRYKEEFYDLLNETVMNEWDFHSFSDVAERLADLIEPEERTCRIEKRRGDWCCTECDAVVGTDDPESELYVDGNAIEMWNYCPNCGARVKEGE